MTRFLSADWVAAFDAALEHVTVDGPGDDTGLAAADGTFSVAQQVRGGPDGDVTTVLQVADGRLHLTLVEPPAEPDADVTVSLAYADAVELSRGTLAAAEALTEGRIRVRGDLSVLAAGQSVLAIAQPHLAGLSADTTY
jgi:hypothetical protein